MNIILFCVLLGGYSLLPTFMFSFCVDYHELFYRQDGQGSSSELKSRDFRRDLDDRERAAREKRTERDYSSSSSKRARIEHTSSSQLDADDPIDQVAS